MYGERQYRGNAVQHELYLTSDDVHDRRCRALVRYVDDFDSRHRLQQLAAQMVRRAITRRRAIELVRLRLRQRDKLLHIRGGNARMRKQQLRVDRSERYGREVPKRV